MNFPGGGGINEYMHFTKAAYQLWLLLYLGDISDQRYFAQGMHCAENEKREIITDV